MNERKFYILNILTFPRLLEFSLRVTSCIVYVVCRAECDPRLTHTDSHTILSQADPIVLARVTGSKASVTQASVLTSLMTSWWLSVLLVTSVQWRQWHGPGRGQHRGPSANFILPGQPGADSVLRIFTESVQIIGNLLYLSPEPGDIVAKHRQQTLGGKLWQGRQSIRALISGNRHSASSLKNSFIAPGNWKNLPDLSRWLNLKWWNFEIKH